MEDKIPLHKLAVLSNGMRVALRQTDSKVSYIGLAVNAGSRDESPECQGLAHFVEHTLFKGTARRNSWHISNRMEAIGGELNAYTSKEETVLYTNAPAGYAERAVELLADIVANSRFPEKEIDREREVVIDEINSYLDSPADAVYDEYEEAMYAGSALAHNILGTPDSVRRLTGSDCRRFLDRFYTPGNMVAYIADPGNPEKLLRIMEKHFGGMHFVTEPRHRITPVPSQGFDIVRDKGGHQAHTILGFPVFGRQDPRRFALFLLNNYLGGPGMNSILNHELRDKRGLVYTVDSNVALLSDTGSMAVYFGADGDDVKKCFNLIRAQIARLADHKLSGRSFDAIQNQYCGQLLVSSDHRESVAMSMAKSVLYYGKIRDITETERHIREVTPEQMREAAELLATSPFCRITLK